MGAPKGLTFLGKEDIIKLEELEEYKFLGD